MNFILDKNSKEYELMGGKGEALAKVYQVIEEIPDWFIVSYEGFDTEKNAIKEEAKSEVLEKLKSFNNEYFAVRSSATVEDSKDMSYAGQFDTYLYVKKEEIIEKIQEVYMSAYSERIETYRKENKIEKISIPSVIVQKMIKSEKSGVAFGANPINSNVKEVIISAVFGLGTGLVDGDVTSDIYTVSKSKIKKEIGEKDFYNIYENKAIIQKELQKDKREIAVLTDEEILKVKKLVKKTSEFFGRFQDIEWAYEGDKLYLLQSRPITTLGKTKDKSEKINVFDNSNIVESYGGITTPLTFSFIRMVYENVYKELCKLVNVGTDKIEDNAEMFKSMLALIDGRVYYNLYGWYGLLGLVPGVNKNKKFMEQMMGVKESLPEDLFPVAKGSFKDKIGLINTGFGVLKSFLHLKSMTRNFYKRLNEALEEKDIENMDLYELHDYYYEFQNKLLYKWDAPLVNDFLAMVFYGQLKKECMEILGEEGSLLYNDLLCGEGGIISAEPAKRIKEMAKIAKDEEKLIELLESDDIFYVKKELKKYKEFNEKLNEYLEKFSDRCLQELKLETETLKENPLSLYHSIAAFARRIRDNQLDEIDSEKNRIEAEKKIKNALSGRQFKKSKFNFLLSQARYTVKNRENLRFERTRVFGRIREIFLRIGFIFASMNVIEEKKDIFYLELDEILFYIDGKSTTNNLKELIALRKKQYENHEENSPDDRFYTYGAVNIGNEFKKESHKVKDERKEYDLKGIGASPGIVRGKVRIVKNPKNVKIEKGEIIVAEFTDPGWIMIFPAASGILVERGSLLSHSAIVSRELGIPCIVGINGLMNSLKDGDIVEMNGMSGEVANIAEK